MWPGTKAGSMEQKETFECALMVQRKMNYVMISDNYPSFFLSYDKSLGLLVIKQMR